MKPAAGRLPQKVCDSGSAWQFLPSPAIQSGERPKALPWPGRATLAMTSIMFPARSVSMPETYRIGVDVGGTNTDAVILDSSGQVVRKYKSPTTSDVESGVRSALHSVLLGAGLDPDSIRFAMLSTTHCTNAIITRQGLVRIGVI